MNDPLETTRHSGTKNLGVCLQISNRLRGFTLVEPYHCVNRTTCTRRYFTENSDIKAGFDIMLCWKVVALSTATIDFFVAVRVSPGHAVP